MAHQTSVIQRKQTTPRPIGRLMDADASRSILPRCIEIRWTLAFAVKGRCPDGVTRTWRAQVVLYMPLRHPSEQ
jgi:hypothetical protein